MIYIKLTYTFGFMALALVFARIAFFDWMYDRKNIYNAIGKGMGICLILSVLSILGLIWSTN